MSLPNLRQLWLAKEEAAEAARVADREVRDSVIELGALMDERTMLSCLPGWDGSVREKVLEAEIQRVRDELVYAKDDAKEAHKRLHKAEAEIRRVLGPPRG